MPSFFRQYVLVACVLTSYCFISSYCLAQESAVQEKGKTESKQADDKKAEDKNQDKEKKGDQAEEKGAKSAPQTKPTHQVFSVAEDKLFFAAPLTWNAIKPKNNIIEKEFQVPRMEGDDADGRLTFMGAGGSVKANLDRWYQQFTQPDGRQTKETATVTEEKVAGLTIHKVDMSGTFLSGAGPFAPKTKMKNYRMLGAIINADKHGQYFFKLTGPEKTIAANAKGFDAMINSLSIGAPPKMKAPEKKQVLKSRDGGLEFSATANWKTKAPRSQMIEVEIVVPKAEGDEADGRLTFMTAGGSVDANVDRWVGQFAELDANTGNEQQTTEEIADRKVHLVDLSGTFNESSGGPFGPKKERKNYRMMAAIVELGDGDDDPKYFLKLTGPAKTLEENAEAFKEMVRSLKVIE